MKLGNYKLCRRRGYSLKEGREEQEEEEIWGKEGKKDVEKSENEKKTRPIKESEGEENR